jgi:hypothetical protein
MKKLLFAYLLLFFGANSEKEFSDATKKQTTTLSTVSSSPRSLFDVLSASSLQTCVQTSSSLTSTSLSNCSMKMIVTGSIQNGDIDGTSIITYDVAATPPMSLPNSDGFTSVYSPDTVSISIRQSEIVLIYPTRYIKDVNDGPYELTYLTDSNNHAFVNPSNRCQANSFQSSCGFAVNANNVRVPFSQGFCCECSTENAFTSYMIPRSGQTCVFTQAHDSAHCLRMSSLWHSLYSIGSPMLSFRLVVFIYQCKPIHATFNASLACHKPSSECKCEMFDSTTVAAYLGPEQPTRCFALPLNPNQNACDIEVKLQGTFAAYEGTPDFSSKYLLIPTHCESGTPSTDICWQRVLGSSDQWLVVDKESVSVDGGSECNKIGVGYEAFATQGRACESNKNSCLSNQPADLYLRDTIALAQQRRYFLSTYRDSSATLSSSYSPTSSKTPSELLLNKESTMSLSLRTRRFQKSLLSLSFRADAESLRLVIKSSPGKLYVPFSLPLIAGSSVTLLIIVENIGDVNARYTISIECPQEEKNALLPVPAREIGVEAKSNSTISFLLYSNTQLTASLTTCSIVLIDAVGIITDKVSLSVVLSNAEVDRGGQGGDIVDVNGRTGSSSNSSVSSFCNLKCPSYWDLGCAIGNASVCVQSMSAWAAGLALGSLFLLCAAFAAFKYPLLFLAPLRAGLGVCCGTSSNNNNNDSDSTHSVSTFRKGKDTHTHNASRATKDTSVVTSSRVLGRGRITTERWSSNNNNPVYSKTLLKTREDAISKSASVSASSGSVEIDIVLTQALQTMNQNQQREMLRRTQLLIREVREEEEEEEEDVHIRTIIQSKHKQIQ